MALGLILEEVITSRAEYDSYKIIPNLSKVKRVHLGFISLIPRHLHKLPSKICSIYLPAHARRHVDT